MQALTGLGWSKVATKLSRPTANAAKAVEEALADASVAQSCWNGSEDRLSRLSSAAQGYQAPETSSTTWDALLENAEGSGLLAGFQTNRNHNHNAIDWRDGVRAKLGIYETPMRKPYSQRSGSQKMAPSPQNDVAANSDAANVAAYCIATNYAIESSLL